MSEPKPLSIIQQMGRAKRPMPDAGTKYKIVDTQTKLWISTYPNGEATWSNEDPPYGFTKDDAEEFAQMFSNAKIIKISNRGGARRGAGRPKKSVNVNRVLVTLDNDEFAAYKANGEGNFLRYLIRKHQGLCMHVNQLNGQCSECGTKPAYQYEKM